MWGLAEHKKYTQIALLFLLLRSSDDGRSDDDSGQSGFSSFCEKANPWPTSERSDLLQIRNQEQICNNTRTLFNVRRNQEIQVISSPNSILIAQNPRLLYQLLGMEIHARSTKNNPSITQYDLRGSAKLPTSTEYSHRSLLLKILTSVQALIVSLALSQFHHNYNVLTNQYKHMKS